MVIIFLNGSVAPLKNSGIRTQCG